MQNLIISDLEIRVGNGVKQCLKRQCAFCPTHRTPNTQPHLLTHTCKSHVWSPVSKMYHIFCEIFNVLHFPWLGLCQSPCLAGLLTSCSKTCGHIIESNYPKPHLTFLMMSFSDWVWTRVMLVPYVYNFGRWLEMWPYLTMIMLFECCI